MKIVFVLLACMISVSGKAQQTLDELLQVYNTRSIPYISVEEAKMLQNTTKVVLLDARERTEFEVSHIPSAKYVGYSEFSSEAISEAIPDKTSLLIVYCSLGIRSEKISEKLKKAGFTNIKNLYGGIFEWKNKGYAVVNMQGQETEKIHVFSKQWSKWLTTGEKVVN